MNMKIKKQMCVIMNFNRILPDPDYCDIIPIEEFRKDVECMLFTDYDGNGHWVKDGKMTDGWGDNVCNLSAIDEMIEKGVTHVCWFNK